MLQAIPIQAVPNQQFSIVLDNNNWVFIIRLTNGCMSVTLSLNTVTIIENMRVVAGQLVIPSQYEEMSAGNFIFLTQNNQLPDWSQFNITQSLVYASASDLASFRTPSSPPITASDFNPLGALPLRFQPTGYVLAV